MIRSDPDLVDPVGGKSRSENKSVPFSTQWSSNNNWANDPEIVPTVWREQFGRDAVTYLREIAGVSSSRQEFDDLVQRVSTVVGGGIERVTWDLDAALAVTGAPAVLRALLARRLAAAGGADAVVVGAKDTATALKVTIKDHYDHHLNMVDDIKDQLSSQGFRVSEKEISFGNSCGTGRCRQILWPKPLMEP